MFKSNGVFKGVNLKKSLKSRKRNYSKVVRRKKKRPRDVPLKYKFDIYNKDEMEDNEDYNKSLSIIQCGVDEAGRGPLFGRVYTACVILPSREDEPEFPFHQLKDSKRFTSKRKLKEMFDIIKEKCIYGIDYADSREVDEKNIRIATIDCMNRVISQVKEKCPEVGFILVDGCDFINKSDIEHICIEGGDDLYMPIAAASILAKVSRDEWIKQMCIEHPELEKYGIERSKGYATREHIEAVEKYGNTPWHRRSFGVCKRMAEKDIK
jgi:ribonuclease HII